MCGICGVLGPTPRARLDALDAMTRTLDHRGPDDRGAWDHAFRRRGDEWVIGLGQTRLSIIDLSSKGHQPMTSADGLATVSYNGEIYNFRALREELTRDHGVRFRSECDTEVLTEGYRALGTEIFTRVNGMFAVSLWDAERDRLVLARDRIGIKPLFYRVDGEVLTFGSELGAVRAHPGFEAEIDRVALGTFLRSGFVHGEHTIYADTRRVLPGELVVWQDGELKRERFWDLLDPAEEPPPEHYSDAVDRLDELLGDAVERRLVSDVPLGAFLSGGIDSSTIVSLMAERAKGRVRSFSIGFREPGFDEAPHARAVADHLGTDHTELYVDRAQAVDVAVALPDLYDEPFADSSAIPTVLLSRLTREHVTVALSGDGGDELFGGYSQYRKLATLLRPFGWPAPLRRFVASAARWLPPSGLRNGLRHLDSRDACELAARLLCHFDREDLLAACGPAGAEIPSHYRDAFERSPTDDAVTSSMFADAASYLPDDILTKVDRASMSVALEARVPLLDHHVVRFALSLPRAFAWEGGRSKAPLRDVLARRVPPALFDRPKMGFGIPVTELLARELEVWTERYLAPARIAEEGLLAPEGAARLIAAARAPGAIHQRLWFLLCFERWFARNHRGEELA